MLDNYGIDIKANYNDCGVMLYDLKRQKEVLAGGSGPVCSALVNYSTVIKGLKENKYKKVILIATGRFIFSNDGLSKRKYLINSKSYLFGGDLNVLS